MNLTEFLLARIAEDEATARAEWDWMIERHGADAWTTGEGAPVDREWAYETDRDWTLHVSPRRVLAECEAKRRIVEADEGLRTLVGNLTFRTEPGRTIVDGLAYSDADFQRLFTKPAEPSDHVKLLAVPYADHPDYDSSWRL